MNVALEDAALRRKLVLFLRRIDEFRTTSFIARRMHLSHAELLAQLSEHEAASGEKLAVVGERMDLTPFARRLLEE